MLPTSTSRRCLNTYGASGFVTVRLHRRHHHHRCRRCYHRRCHRRCCCFVRRRRCFLLRSPLRGPLGIGGGFLPPPCCHRRESRSLQRSRLLPRKRCRLRRSPVPLGIGTGGLLPQLWARPPRRRPRSQTPLRPSAEEPAPRRPLLGPTRGSALGSLG